jgi:hypothetical protein
MARRRRTRAQHRTGRDNSHAATSRNVMGAAMENTTAASLGIVDDDDDFQKNWGDGGMYSDCCFLLFFLLSFF